MGKLPMFTVQLQMSFSVARRAVFSLSNVAAKAQPKMTNDIEY
jgi:hypothetical protein